MSLNQSATRTGCWEMDPGLPDTPVPCGNWIRSHLLKSSGQKLQACTAYSPLVQRKNSERSKMDFDRKRSRRVSDFSTSRLS
eukprot:10346_6